MFTVTCPRCLAVVALPARRLLVRVDEEQAMSGEGVFTCLSCHETVVLPLDAPAVAALVASGVGYLSFTPPAVEHPEQPPDGPVFTSDDLIDLHVELTGEEWMGEVGRPEC